MTSAIVLAFTVGAMFGWWRRSVESPVAGHAQRLIVTRADELVVLLEHDHAVTAIKITPEQARQIAMAVLNISQPEPEPEVADG